MRSCSLCYKCAVILSLWHDCTLLIRPNTRPKQLSNVQVLLKAWSFFGTHIHTHQFPGPRKSLIIRNAPWQLISAVGEWSPHIHQGRDQESAEGSWPEHACMFYIDCTGSRPRWPEYKPWSKFLRGSCTPCTPDLALFMALSEYCKLFYACPWLLRKRLHLAHCGQMFSPHMAVT